VTYLGVEWLAAAGADWLRRCPSPVRISLGGSLLICLRRLLGSALTSSSSALFVKEFIFKQIAPPSSLNTRIAYIEGTFYAENCNPLSACLSVCLPQPVQSPCSPHHAVTYPGTVRVRLTDFMNRLKSYRYPLSNISFCRRYVIGRHY
jgi:hypothetical protein